ncbi:Tex-like N-terminal domain-containing protein [Mangrovimonas sp. YM274]|nr:Tex-like N-terminal domain-containing protein [Mangrovimonas sp. YM274]WMI69205.1 Tex-like N-terminal domain-containing protein [Mangrovimonas sp. YM274]
MSQSIISYIISFTNLPESGVKNTLQLLEEDCTVPFISRYQYKPAN